MEAWGIIMTALTMFGMLALTVASASMDSGSQTFGSQTFGSQQRPEDSTPASVDLKKAA